MLKIIIASGPVIVSNNKVLLNSHGEDIFLKFCGGRVENFDDNLIEAARREAFEEIGVDINILNFEPFIMHVKKKKEGQDIDVILVHYLAEISASSKIKRGNDIREVKWVELEKLENENLAPNIIPTLRHFKLIK